MQSIHGFCATEYPYLLKRGFNYCNTHSTDVYKVFEILVGNIVLEEWTEFQFTQDYVCFYTMH